MVPARIRVAIALGCCLLATCNAIGDEAVGQTVAEGPAPTEQASSGAGTQLELLLRTQVPTDGGEPRPQLAEVEWDPRRTAMVICDMWNEHWCRGATRRVAQMAPRMNEVIKTARDRGVLIIHCPSACMDFYKDHPARARAIRVEKFPTKRPLQGWCHIDSDREGSLPIDDSDGGCDCWPRCKEGSPWFRQIESLGIENGDAITDSDEAYHLIKQRGIENVIVMGVHTNMCVLGRPFSIRQLAYQDLNVALMRDLTDTMYNSRRAPFVDHNSGTDLVVEHIERHWGPTLTSDQFVGGAPFRFAEDKRPHLVMVIAEDEYETAKTLPRFAANHLRERYKVTQVIGQQEGRQTKLLGLEALDNADVLLISVRRKAIPQQAMKRLQKFVKSGRPVVAIRTSSHAFNWKGKEPPEGYALWPDFDKEVIGGSYSGHYSNKPPHDPPTTVRFIKEAEKHPILQGLAAQPFRLPSWMYRYENLDDSTTLLLRGTIDGTDADEPLAWTNENEHGGAVFYTSLGHAGDFKDMRFQLLLENAIDWAAKQASHANSSLGTAKSTAVH